MDKELTSSAVSTPPTRFQFRLRHLFALAVVTSVMLFIDSPQEGVSLGFSRFSVGGDPRLQAVYTFLQLAQTFLAAIAITAAFTIFRRPSQNELAPQPGHWLLFELACFDVLRILLFAVGKVSVIVHGELFDENGDVTESGSHVVLILIIVALLMLLFRIFLNIYIGSKKFSDSRWRYVFYAKAAAVVSQVLGEFLTAWFFAIGDPLVLLFILISARIDNREGMKRDAGHWCGVIVQLADIAVRSVIIFVVYL